AALPDIDVGVLELAGFKTASQITDSFRARTGLLEETGSGAYRCPAPFAEFLRHRTALLPANEREAVHLRAARALEAAGNVEHALRSYVTAKSQSDALRLLEVHGFDLLERGQSEAVSQAIDALDDATRRNRPRILALRGVLQSLDGNPVRAETLLRRSLSRAKDDRDLVGFASLRLAPLIANDGGDVAEILNPVADDPLQSVSVRAESLSLLATTRAIAGAKSAATKAALAVERLLIDIDLDSTRARVLQRVGVAAMYSGDNERSKQTLIQAADLATELGLHSVASRSWSALSNSMCHAYDDVMSQLWYAERAAGAARRSGNSLELQTALLQVAAAEMRRGNAEESAAIEEQLVGIRSDPRRAQLLVAFKALRLSWEGHFDEAHRELATSWGRMHHDFDRLICGAQCALFLALDGRRKSSISLISEVASLAEAIRPDGLFRVRYVALALLFCVVAEVVNERATNANRLVRRIGIDNADPVVYLAARTAEEFILPSRGVRRSPEISVALERLSALGYADVARVLQAVCGALDAKTVNADLTRSELAVLRLLGEGLTTKEIAVRHGRSTNTIRAHIANALGKLGCHRRVQAVAVARKLEIIS
ncbi:MAG: LuxR C-terminal-related transcriptional regulator, partial [Candidatus Tumulicola sp.]